MADTITFRLSPELRDRLQSAAGDRPMGEEIRRRLELSFGAAAPDPTTRKLLEALAAAAGFLDAIPAPVLAAIGLTDQQPGHWYDEPMAHAAFKDAAGTLIDQLGTTEPPDREVWRMLAAMALNAGLQTLPVEDRIQVQKITAPRRKK